MRSHSQSGGAWRLAAALACVLTSGASLADGHKTPAAYRELLNESMTKKFGLTFFVRGQVIPGVVTAISDDGAVEARNQEHDRIVIRLDRVDAIAH